MENILADNENDKNICVQLFLIIILKVIYICLIKIRLLKLCLI